MDKTTARKLAERIADDLFTSHSGKRADRLAMETPHGHYLGSLIYGATVQKIEMILKETNGR